MIHDLNIKRGSESLETDFDAMCECIPSIQVFMWSLTFSESQQDLSSELLIVQRQNAVAQFIWRLSLLLCSATSFSLSSHVPCKQLENGPHAPMYQLLNLFAYGTYCDYKGIFIGSREHSVNK